MIETITRHPARHSFLGSSLLLSIVLVGALSTLMMAPVASAQPRIVGGTQSDPDAYPWAVALIQSDYSDTYFGQFCGGSLIAPNWVLTAAHCVDDATPASIDVVVGASVLGASSDGQRLDVDRIVIHPNYSPDGTPDLALVRLRTNSNRTPVGLVTPGSGLASANTLARVIGWGATSEQGTGTRRLRETNIPIVSQAVCENAYGSVIESDEICAGLTAGGQDSCFGDSGGPLFVKDASGSKFLQAGIVSWGEGCARPRRPGVYARVSTFFDWINTTTGNALEGTPATPTGTLTAAFKPRCEGLTCEFSAVSSSAGASPIETYWWNLGDGTFETGRTVTHTYTSAGTYTATLFVVDESGEVDDRVKEITVSTDGIASEDITDAWNGTVNRDTAISVPDRDGMWINSGKLKVVLRHDASINLDLKLQKFNDNTGKWQVIETASTTGKKELIRLQPADEGMYRYRVIARGNGGTFELSTVHR